MRFALVTGRVFTCVCIGCNQPTRAGDCDASGNPVTVGPTWADLDGEPWKAYYCEPCKRTAQEDKHATAVSIPGA